MTQEKDELEHDGDDDDVELSAKDLGQFEVFIARVLSPLYNQSKNLTNQQSIIVWGMITLQLITLSVYRVVGPSPDPSRITYYPGITQTSRVFFRALGYIDGSQWGFLAGNYISFAAFGSLFILLLCICILGGFSIYLERLQMSNKGLISLNRIIFNLMLPILFIIFINIGISNFDCFCKDGESQISYLLGGTAQCFKGNTLQIGGAVAGISVCVIFLMMQIPLNLFLFDNNYKRGGHFSTYSGSSSAVEYIILFGLVFAQRELVNWYFWRGLVTIGTATLMAAFYILYQPYYRNTGNILIASRYCIYGTVRLFMEIAYAVERSVMSKVDSAERLYEAPKGHWIDIFVYVMFGLGILAGIIESVLCSVFIKWLNKKRWILDKENKFYELPYQQNTAIEQKQDESKLITIDLFQDIWMIERRMRFLLQKDLRELQYVFYANFCFNIAQHLHKDDPVLLFHYATFLKQIAKQPQAASDVIIRCRILRPPIALRVVLASQVLEQQRERMLKNKLKATLLRRTLTALEQRRLDNAEDNLEEALGDMRMFWEGLLRPQPDLWELQIHLEHIADLTTKTQDIYIQLLETCVNNPTVLRSYSLFSGQLLRDETEALISKERAQAIEREFKKMIITHQYQKTQYDVDFDLQRERSNTSASKFSDQEVTDRLTQYSFHSRGSPLSQNYSASVGQLDKNEQLQQQQQQQQTPTTLSKQSSTYQLLKLQKKRELKKKREKDRKLQNQSLILKKSGQIDTKNTDNTIIVQGQGTAQLISNSNLIVGTHSGLQHVQGFVTQFVCFLALIVVGEVMMQLEVNAYMNSLDSLFTLCNLGYFTSKLSCTAIDLFLHEQKNWDPKLFNEGDINIALTPVPAILESLNKTANSIEKISKRIYSKGGSIAENWEKMDIDMLFMNWDQDLLQIGDRTIRVMSLLGVETALVQQVRIITSEANKNRELWPQILTNQKANNDNQTLDNNQMDLKLQQSINSNSNFHNQSSQSQFNAVIAPLSSIGFYEALLFLLINPLQPVFEGTKRAMVVMQESCESWKIAVIYSYPALISLFAMCITVGAILTETTLLKFTENQRIKAFKNICNLPSNDVRSELRKCIVSIMNVGVTPEEKEQDKEREDELNKMRDELEFKEEQMSSFLKEKEKENQSFKDNQNLQEKETDRLSLYQSGSRKKLAAQSATSLNDRTDRELINDKNQDKNITHKVSDSKDQHNKLFTYTELHPQKHASSEVSYAQTLRLLKKNINKLKSTKQGKQKKKRVPVEQRHFFDIGWQQQLDAHIERLANLYQSIPLQIQYTVFKILTINLLIMDAMFILIIVLFVIYQYRFTDAHANIVMSGIYQSLLMMVKFVSGRMIAPSSKIEPAQDLEFSISTNACFRNLEHMSSNTTKLMELLGCLGEYAVSVAHRGYFESKQITPKHGYDEITDEDDEAKMSYDSFIDSIKTGRMNQKLLSNALLQGTSCLGREFVDQDEDSTFKSSNKLKKNSKNKLKNEIEEDFDYEDEIQMCSLPIYQRVFRKEEGYLYGILGLESRLLHNIRLLSKLYLDEHAMQKIHKIESQYSSEGYYSNMQPESKYIQSVLHYDLAVGGNALGHKQMNDAEQLVQDLKDIILVLSIVCTFAEIILCIVCAIAHLMVYRKISVQTFSLVILYESILQSDEQELEELRRFELEQYDIKQQELQQSMKKPDPNMKQYEFSEALPISFAQQSVSDTFNNLAIWTSASPKFREVMVTNVNWLDEGRMHIADAANNVTESLTRGDDMKSVLKTFELLINGAKQFFNKEEIASENLI
ncbi:MAG: hypothetical protein EZS28_004517, partial [Streblomastix strix]